METVADKARKWTEVEKWWMKENLQIQDRVTGKLKPFILNVLQEDFAYKLNYQRAMGFPVRVQLLKPRKVGFSTYVSARYYMHSLLEENLKCMIIAHTADTTDTLFQMQKVMHECLPTNVYRETEQSSRKEIRFSAPHRSHMRTLTAGGKEIGRGMDLHRAHFSEYHFWQPESSFISSLNAMSQGDYYETLLESTANGAHGKSYMMWKDAEDHRKENPDDWDCWQDIFYSWLQVPWYRADIPRGYEWGEESPEEYELRQLGADKEQLYWRRLTLPIRCNNDPDYFKQEYPHTRESAFLYSQGAVFKEDILHPHLESVEKAPLSRKYSLEWEDENKTSVIAVETDHPFAWTIWRMPEQAGDYVIGADPAGHSVSDPNNERSQRDWDCAAIRDRRRHDHPAVYRGRSGSKDEFGNELLKAATFYNQAWIVPEINQGDAILVPLKTYPNLYQREGEVEEIEERMMGRYGWRTTDNNRTNMINEWKVVCRLEGDSHDEKVKIYSKVCLEEEQTFVHNKRGKAEHAAGCHDDMLFAHMLANMGHIRLPMRYSEAQFDYGKKTVPTVNQLLDGMCDPGPELQESEEQEYIEVVM